MVTEMMRKMCLIQIEKEKGSHEQYIRLGAFKETIIHGINYAQCMHLGSVSGRK